MILLCILLLACFGHGFLWVGWINRIHAIAGPRLIIDFLTFLCVLAFVGIPLSLAYSWLDWLIWDDVNSPKNLSSLSPKTVSNWQLSIWHSIYVNLCALSGGGMILWRLLGPCQVDPPNTLRNLNKKMLNLATRSHKPLPVGRTTQLMCLVPINQTLHLSVEKKRIALPQLNKTHEGLSIAHISDLHMTGRIDCEFFRLVANEVNALQPDIIVLTGDILESETCRPWLAKSLGRMQSRFGKYFILGNHDQFVDFMQTRRMLSELGWIDVGSRSHHVSLHGSPVMIAGNELPWFSPAASGSNDKFTESDECVKMDDTTGLLEAAHPLKATHQRENRPLRLLLTHSPDQFPWCCQHNIDLVFAGHTHGGQVCLPLLGPVACPSKYGTRYASGVFKKGNTVMHVTRGISGETPFRWNCPPELALLELVRG